MTRTEKKNSPYGGNDSSTIAALATPPGRGGIAIVRVSGPLAAPIAKRILGQVPTPRHALHTPFLDEMDQSLDEGIAIFFPGPHSFTGEDVLELQGHGGPAVVDLLLRYIVTLGARLARPGEFSERAFLNNKMDLAQAEAIADLINASSEQAARSALRSLQGEFSKRINALVEALIRLRIYVEAAIDFAEEEIDFLADQHIADQLTAACLELSAIQSSAKQGTLLRDGITVVIAGQPNVGKSSLLNQLSGKEAAIVTDIPGTTRDVLREYITLDGMPLHVIDTAGLRESEDLVEQEGMRRARQEIAQADLILLLHDATQPDVTDNLLSDIPTTVPVIIIKNKIDLLQQSAMLTTHDHQTIISLSAKAGTGIELLKNHIKRCVGLETVSEGTFSARRRHLDALARASEFLHNGQHQLQVNRAGELLADDLRQAQLALSEITGEFSSDDLLGRIFSSFCIGK